MNFTRSNFLLNMLKDVFDIYCINSDYSNRKMILKLLYEKRIIDIKYIDIFQIHDFLKTHKIYSNDDGISFKDFLNLVLFIYLNHKASMQQDERNEKLALISQCLEEDKDLDPILGFQENLSKEKLIAQTMNEVSIISSFIQSTIEEETKCVICFPDFTSPDIVELLDILDDIHPFKEKLYTVFSQKCQNNNYDIEYITFENLVEIVNICNIFNNFPSIRIADVLYKFMNPYKFNFMNEEFRLIFDDPRISKSKSLIETQLSKFNLNINDLRFSFSSFVLFISAFHKYLKANSERTNLRDSLLHYYQFVIEVNQVKSKEIYAETHKLSLKTDDRVFGDPDDKRSSMQYDFPPSKYLEEAIKLEESKDDDEEALIIDAISALDKELGPVSIYDTNLMVENGLTKDKQNPIIFPFNLLKSDVDEENARNEQNYKNQRIANAKKKTNQKKDVVYKPLNFEDMPTEQKNKDKYYGSSLINDLKGKFFKNSYKQLLSNTYVYPSIISESLIVPRKIPNEIKSLVLSSLNEYVNGNHSLALSQLERAQDECKDLMLFSDAQINLYFSLQFGNIFMSMNLFSKALIFLNTAKVISNTNMSSGNPDIALVYCYLGYFFIKLNEPDLALRCYWKAKFLRESIIGGDTLDTATVYNNIGVCFYYLKSYYEAHCYFKLSYEIYKEYE